MPTVKTCPVMEAVARSMFGIQSVPVKYQQRMINRAAKEANRIHEEKIKEVMATLERKIKDRMEWYKKQPSYDPRYPNTYRDCHDELNEVLGMIGEGHENDR